MSLFSPNLKGLNYQKPGRRLKKIVQEKQSLDSPISESQFCVV